MDAFRHIRERLRNTFAGRKQAAQKQDPGYHHAISPETQQAIFGSYCPVAPCAVLLSLRNREDEVFDWLKSCFVDEFGPDKPMDLLSESCSKSLIGMQRIFNAKWRLFKLPFDVRLGWTGFQQAIGDSPFSSFTYTRKALADYCHRAPLHVGYHQCGSCSAQQSVVCTSTMKNILGIWFSAVDESATPSPDFDNFDHVQKAAWSLAISISTVMMIGAAVGGNSVLIWGWNLLDNWEPRLRRAMAFRGDSVEDFVSIPPPYSSGSALCA